MNYRLPSKLVPLELVAVSAKTGVATGRNVATFTVAYAGQRGRQDLVEIRHDAVNMASSSGNPIVNHEFADPASVGPTVVRAAQVVGVDAEGVCAAVKEAGLERQPVRAILELGRWRIAAIESELENIGDHLVRQ